MNVQRAVHDVYNTVEQFGGLNTYQVYIAISEFGKFLGECASAASTEEELEGPKGDNMVNKACCYDLINTLASSVIYTDTGESVPSTLGTSINAMNEIVPYLYTSVTPQDTYWSRLLVGGLSQVGDLRVPLATADAASMIFSQIEGCVWSSIANLNLSGNYENVNNNNNNTEVIERAIENVNSVSILLKAFFGQRTNNNTTKDEKESTLQEPPKSQRRTLEEFLADDDNEEADLPINLLGELLHDYSEGVLLSCFTLIASAAYSVHAVLCLAREAINALTNTTLSSASSVNNHNSSECKDTRKETFLESLRYLVASAQYSCEQLYLSNIMSHVCTLLIKRADAITSRSPSLASQGCGRVVGNLRNAQRENLRHKSGESTEDDDTNYTLSNETSKASFKTKRLTGGFKLCPPAPGEESFDDDYISNGVTLFPSPQPGSTMLEWTSSDALGTSWGSSCASRPSSSSFVSGSSVYRHRRKWSLVPSFGESGAQIVALGLQIMAWHYEVHEGADNRDNSVNDGSYTDPKAAADSNVTKGLRGGPMSLPQKRLDQLRRSLIALLRHCAGVQTAAIKSQLGTGIITDERNDSSAPSALNYTAKLAVPVSRLLYHIVVTTISKERRGMPAGNNNSITVLEAHNKDNRGKQKNNYHVMVSSKENTLNCGSRVGTNDDNDVSVDCEVDKTVDKEIRNGGVIPSFHQWARVSLAEETILPAINRYCMLLLMMVRNNHQQLYRECVTQYSDTTADNSRGETQCEKITRVYGHHILLLVHTIESLAKLAAEILSYSFPSIGPVTSYTDSANMEWLRRVFNIADNTVDGIHPQDTSENSGASTTGRIRNESVTGRHRTITQDSLHFLSSVLSLRNSIMSSADGGHAHIQSALSTKAVGDAGETTISLLSDNTHTVPPSYTTEENQLDTPLFVVASILWALVVVPAIRACPSLPQCVPLAKGLEEHFSDAFEVATDRLMLSSAVDVYYQATQPNTRSPEGNRQLENGAISLRNSLMEAVAAAIECNAFEGQGTRCISDTSGPLTTASYLIPLLLSHSLDSFCAIVNREIHYTTECIKEQKENHTESNPGGVVALRTLRSTAAMYLYSCRYLMSNAVEWLKGWFQFISSVVQPPTSASDPNIVSQVLPLITRASRLTSTNIVSTFVYLIQFCEESFDGEQAQQDGALESTAMIPAIQRTLAEGTLELMVTWTNTTSVMYLSKGIEAALSGKLSSGSTVPITPKMIYDSGRKVNGDISSSTRGYRGSRSSGRSKMSTGVVKRRPTTAGEIHCSDGVDALSCRGFENNLLRINERKSSRQNHMWPSIDDIDDLHDFLVAVVPIMNAILQMSSHFIILTTNGGEHNIDADNQHIVTSVNPPNDPLTRYWDTVLQVVLRVLGTSNDLPMQVMCLYTMYNAIHAIQNKTLVEIPAPTYLSLNKHINQPLPLAANYPSSATDIYHVRRDLATHQDNRPSINVTSFNFGSFISNPSGSRRHRVISTRQYLEPSPLSLMTVCTIVVSKLVQVRVGQVASVLGASVGWMGNSRISNDFSSDGNNKDNQSQVHRSLSHRRLKVKSNSQRTIPCTTTGSASPIAHSTPGSPSETDEGNRPFGPTPKHSINSNQIKKAEQSLFWYILSEMLLSADKFLTSDNPEEQGYSKELYLAIMMLVEKVLSNFPPAGGSSYKDVMQPVSPSEVSSNLWGVSDIFLVTLIKHTGRCLVRHHKLMSLLCQMSLSSAAVVPDQRCTVRSIALPTTPEVDVVIKLLMTWLQPDGVRRRLHRLDGGPVVEALATVCLADLSENITTTQDVDIISTKVTNSETTSDRDAEGNINDNNNNSNNNNNNNRITSVKATLRTKKSALFTRFMAKVYETSLALANGGDHTVNTKQKPIIPTVSASHIAPGRHHIAACAQQLSTTTLCSVLGTTTTTTLPSKASYSKDQQAWWYVACQAQKYAHENLL